MREGPQGFPLDNVVQRKDFVRGRLCKSVADLNCAVLFSHQLFSINFYQYQIPNIKHSISFLFDLLHDLLQYITGFIANEHFAHIIAGGLRQIDDGQKGMILFGVYRHMRRRLNQQC